MELTVLGCSGSYSTPETACSGYLLRQDGFAMWVDAGNGTLAELQRHVALPDLDAVYLSHVHPDHCSDMFPFFYAILFGHPRETPVPIFTPPGVRERLECLVGDDTKTLFRERLTWNELGPGDVTEAGPLRLEIFDSAHSAPNNTLRVSASGKTICYSGDTGPHDELARAAREADLFVCEASWLDEHRGIMAPIHLTARQAGDAARAAGAARLMLTHMWPTNDREAARAQAAERFGADVELALETQQATV